mgnify:CR=1 FL=1
MRYETKKVLIYNIVETDKKLERRFGASLLDFSLQPFLSRHHSHKFLQIQLTM